MRVHAGAAPQENRNVNAAPGLEVKAGYAAGGSRAPENGKRIRRGK